MNMIKRIVNKIIYENEKIIDEIYADLEQECSTYGELKSNISFIDSNIRFFDSFLASVIANGLEKRMEEKIDVLPIKKNEQDVQPDNHKM